MVKISVLSPACTLPSAGFSLPAAGLGPNELEETLKLGKAWEGVERERPMGRAHNTRLKDYLGWAERGEIQKYTARGVCHQAAASELANTLTQLQKESWV